VGGLVDSEVPKEFSAGEIVNHTGSAVHYGEAIAITTGEKQTVKPPVVNHPIGIAVITYEAAGTEVDRINHPLAIANLHIYRKEQDRSKQDGKKYAQKN